MKIQCMPRKRLTSFTPALLIAAFACLQGARAGEILEHVDQAALKLEGQQNGAASAFEHAFEAGDELTEFTFRAEHGVAWLVIKGFSTKETADLRGTSEGTIKAQCNAIYRKVGVTGRTQLLAFMVEDLLLQPDHA